MRTRHRPIPRFGFLGAIALVFLCAAPRVAAKDKSSASDDNNPEPPAPPVTTDLANSGTLIGHGVTIGGGLEASVGGAVAQTIPNFMPYVAFFPGAWAVHGNISKAYCEGRYIKGQDAAKEYADSVAKYNTKKKLGKGEDDKVTREDILSATGWDTSLDGRCGVFTWIGVYFGKPSSMRVNSTYAGNAQPRDFTSYISVGLISSPVAYFSLFAGATFWSYEDTDAKTDRFTTTFTLGLGTNLDVLSQFFK